MELKEETKLSEVIREYPWLRKEAKEIDPQLGIIDSPLGNILLKRLTVKDAADKVNMSFQQIKELFEQLIKAHEEGISAKDFLSGKL